MMEPARLELAGGKLVYDTFGRDDAARVYLIIHGFAGDRLSWLGMGPRLGERHFAIVPDLPGHGDTTLEEADVERLHTVLPPLLETLGITADRLHIVGVSMGAIVATRLADAMSSEGRPPQSLVLISAAGLGLECNEPVLRGFVEGPTVGAFSHLLRRLARHVPELTADEKAFAVERLALHRVAGLAQSLYGAEGQRIDIVAALERLVAARVPVRLASGLADEIFPWQQVLNAPPQVGLHLFRDAGHMVHWDEMDGLLAVIEG